jgi:thymidylate synthase (FAD)
MTVKLISYTMPTVDLISKGIELPEDLIAYCARVSNPENQYNTETSAKLLNYCAKNSHWSIFEMVNATIEINTSRDIARQILRHRSFSFQEFSQRYSKVSEKPIISELRLQDNKNRQNSIETDDISTANWWEAHQILTWDRCFSNYNLALVNGVAKELARKLLPEGLTPSTMYMNGTMRSWIHFCALRTGNGTQKEHMHVAKECAKVLAPIFPLIKWYTERTNEVGEML